MAIHIEGLTVIVRARAAQRLPRGIETFKSIVRNATFATDGNLLRVAFMSPDDVESFIDQLEEFGLTHIENNFSVDISVVDQVRGPTATTPWLQIFSSSMRGHSILCARLEADSADSVVFPKNWSYESSLYVDSVYVDQEEVSRMLPVTSENGVDMVVDLDSGKVVYMTSSIQDEEGQANAARLPQLFLARSGKEVFAREESAIEYARLTLLESGECVVPKFAPPKKRFRQKLERHIIYPRPEEKTIDALVKLYGLWRFPVITVGIVGFLYGRQAEDWAGKIYDRIFKERQNVLREEEEYYADTDYMDRPHLMRVPVPSIFLRQLEENLPRYDAGLE